MAQARRSSAEQSNPTGAHSPSEGSPTEKAPTARSTARKASQPAKGKGPAAASRKPRGAAASGPRARNPEVASALQAATRERAAAASVQGWTPAIASSQAPILREGVPIPTGSGDLPAIAPEAWRLLTSPAARFHAWVATHASADAALDAICDHIVEGNSLLAFCRDRGFTYSQVTGWLNDERAPHRAVNYARAREDRADVFADESLQIVDNIPRSRSVDPDTGAVTEVLEPSAVQEAKLRAEARRWVAARMKPRVYGDKLAVGGDPDAPPIQTAVEHRISFGGPQGASLPLAEVVEPGRLPAPDSEDEA